MKSIEQLCEFHAFDRSYWYIMTDTPFEYASRRTVLRSIGAGATGAAGITGTASAKRGNGGNKGGKRPLEETSSLVAALNYRGTGTTFEGFADDPADANFDPGREFDTTNPEVVGDGRLIHYQLPFGTHKPYVLHHEGDGRYTPRGAVTNFETDGSAPPGLPPGRYRATVREEVNLYEKGGYFDWSATRVDFFDRPGMEYVTSTLIILWDEDAEENDDPSVRTDDPTPGKDTPEFSEDILGDVYEEIKTAAEELIDAGVSTLGGT